MQPSAPVLVVDDDPLSRRVLSDALALGGIAHTLAVSGEDALAKIVASPPSLVLLDLLMPEPDGYAVLREIRRRVEVRDVPVVVLTALDTADDVTRAFEAGADDFVRKPFRPAELIARIRGQLRLRATVLALEKKEKDAQLVLEFTQALAANLDFRSILFTVVQRIAEVVKVDRVSIVLVRDLREQGGIGYVVAASDDERVRDLPIELSKYPEIQQVLTSREPLVIEDVTTHPVLEAVRMDASMPSFSSLAIVPILYENRAMGVLFLRARHAFDFGDHELALCRTVSSAMAIALRNARVMQTLRDQTQQVTVARFEAERRLRTLQRYADFFESAADGIVVIDPIGQVLFANPRACEITGYSEADLRGRRFADLLLGQAPLPGAEMRSAMAIGKYQWADLQLRRKDGSILTLSANYNSVLREEGATVCSFRDVTAERAVEAELVKTKDFLQRIIDSSLDAIISADLRGRILLVNRAAERIYGRPAAEMLGMDVRDVYPPLVAVQIMKRLRDSAGRIEGMRTDIVDAKGFEPTSSTRRGGASRCSSRRRSSTKGTPRSAPSGSSPISAKRC